jgi:conjugal transfer mating pair stabilization protein TraN
VRLWLPFILLGTVLASPALGQSETAQQGEDLAKSVRQGSATTILQSGAENSVPGYGGTDIDASKYLDDEEALTDAGVNARYSDPNYGVVIDPTRPEFDPSTIDLSDAKAVENDPQSFLGAGLNADGAAGSCEPLPNGATPGSTYYETCNQGDQIVSVQQTCSSTLNVSFDRVTSFIYYSATQGPYASRAVLEPAIADGTCKSRGTFDYCKEVTQYGFSPASGCKPNNFSPEIFECNREIGGMTAADPSNFNGLVKATNQFWASKSEMVGPPVVSRVDGACPYATNPSCTSEGAEVCTSSDPVTRVIDGVSVTQPCWAWSRTFKCHERRPGPTKDCSAIESKPECHFDHNECLSENDDGSCNVWDKVYACKTPEVGTGEHGGSICGGDLYCINGECTQVEREASTEFKDAMVAVQTMGNVRDHFDPDTMTLFNGTKEGCHKPVFGLVNCCAGKTSGLITTAAGAAALASGPAAIGLLATPFLTMFLCSTEEKTLDVKDRMGLCHYVGTYCSDKVLGVCTSKRKSYCCFESKLSRILQEQGRAQLNKPWGKPKDADCKGFLIEEFQKLDLSKMDFTEVYSEFIDAAKVPDEIQTSIEIQDKIDEYYKLHAGAGAP